MFNKRFYKKPTLSNRRFVSNTMLILNRRSFDSASLHSGCPPFYVILSVSGFAAKSKDPFGQRNMLQRIGDPSIPLRSTQDDLWGRKRSAPGSSENRKVFRGSRVRMTERGGLSTGSFGAQAAPQDDQGEDIETSPVFT